MSFARREGTLLRSTATRAVALGRAWLCALWLSAPWLAALSCRQPAEPLPELGQVGAFSLLDQTGQTFSEQRLAGTPWVAAFMFTRCPTVCPMMTTRMQRVQALAGQRGVDLRLLSFSVDPEHDTPRVLREYAKTRGIDTSNWWLVTGDSRVVRETAERGFKIGVEGSADPSAQHYGITHGTHLVLLDKSRTIRGYYQSSDEERVEALLRDAARLARAAAPR